ncbi:AI-2E family transporter [Paractinoplanes maris]|uniref:AI-2E family transporter n=1 Tax=Paractinoplanes maris TaxID=1734446 RepID=UPI002021171E|nr:AI-2E family transporter [Actinoplanes maris]
MTGESMNRALARTGRAAWMVTGIVVVAVAGLLALILLLPYLSPLIVAVVLGAVLLPLVNRAKRRGLAAILAALAVPVLLIAVEVVTVLALRGDATQWADAARQAATEVRDATGADPVTPLFDASQRHELLLGAAGLAFDGVAAVFGLLVGALLAVYVLFFLLKDAPALGEGLVRRMPVPAATGREMLRVAVLQMRRYVVGTTVVAAMDTVVITAGAAILRLPLLGVIALVTFVAAFIPYIGAWLSAIFVVIVALGSGGPETAAWMLVIVLITQNVLEGVLRPYAFGVALDMHPLAVLAVTVAGGALGGVVGVFIAPPVAAILLAWHRMRSPARDRQTVPLVPAG